jgi:hypothetical protein
MTVRALLHLLDEIDTQGGPEAARRDRLHLPDAERATEPMTTAPKPSTPSKPPATAPAPALALAWPSAEQMPVDKLLSWGEQHPDTDVQERAARARAALVGLRARYDADQELTAISTEAADLEKRLAELRAREAELAPTKPKTKKGHVDYPAAEVRAWAKEHGIDCPATGRVPKAVVDAWKQATT